MRRIPQVRASRAAAVGLIAVGMVAVGVAGCVSLLPKEKPSQSYRFGADMTASVAPPSSGPHFTIRAAPITFERAAAGDRILTVEGDQTAFIAGARWVTAANSLFDAAVTRAFETHGGAARLLSLGEPAAADYLLKLDVRTFEVRYEHGLNTDPTVAVEVYAALDSREDPSGHANRVFQAKVPVGSNSVHDIAAAFDAAVGKVLTDIVTWADAKGAG